MKTVFVRLLSALAALTVFFIVAGCSDPSDISVRIDSPLRVGVGEQFEVRALIANESRKDQKLVDVDISSSWLDGLVVMYTDPPFTSASYLKIGDEWSYSFDKTIPAEGILELTLYCEALYPGDWAGEADFCINTSFNFLTQPLRTIISE